MLDYTDDVAEREESSVRSADRNEVHKNFGRDVQLTSTSEQTFAQ